jgi:hypothetical protein
MRMISTQQARNRGVALYLIASAALAGAQTSAPSSGASPAPYQDKLIGGSLTPDSSDATEPPYNREGLPRGYSLETSWDRRGVSNTTQVLGLRATAFVDTLFWGSFSGQLGLQQGRASQAAGLAQSNQQIQWQLRQQGMPLNGGWQIDNVLGQINLPVPELARSSLRVGLPSSGMLGLNSQWRQSAGLQINAAVGRAGSFSGFPVARFDTTEGSYAYLSAQDRASFGGGAGHSNWLYGAALAIARNGSAASLSQAGGDAASVYLAAQRQWPNSAGLAVQPNSLQINLLHSEKSGATLPAVASATAQGLWLDGSFSTAGNLNQWGLFHLEPNLSWLDASVASNLQGGYWRHSWRTRQWSSESALELLQPAQGDTPAGFFATQAVRYQYSTLISYGGSLSLRRYNGDAEAVQVYGQWSHGLGSTRVQVEAARSDPADKLLRVQIDHDVNASADLRFATSLSVDREKRSGLPSRGFGLALNADWQLTPYLVFTQTAQSRFVGGQAQYTLNSGLSWRIAPQWSLNATVFAVQGNPQPGAVVQSPLTPAPAARKTLQDKGVFVSLRYSEAAGSARAPIGGTVGSAAGSVQGVIYLDENGNGKQEASERGVPQVTVLLNGRFAASTDAQGKFEFPYVAAGNHGVTVVSDNLPLPWGISGEGKQTIRVYSRDLTRVTYGAVKQ